MPVGYSLLVYWGDDSLAWLGYAVGHSLAVAYDYCECGCSYVVDGEFCAADEVAGV